MCLIVSNKHKSTLSSCLILKYKFKIYLVQNDINYINLEAKLNKEKWCKYKNLFKKYMT